MRVVEVVLSDKSKVNVRAPKGSELAMMLNAIMPLQALSPACLKPGLACLLVSLVRLRSRSKPAGLLPHSEQRTMRFLRYSCSA